MNSRELRRKYINFFISKGHKEIPSASLIPENDPSLLFTNSGMSPLIPYLLGEKHPLGSRLVNSQKCFRAEDIEEIGDHRHTTFFEMLGNWSLGDYFKKEQLTWWYEFLVEELKLDPNRLYQTVFAGDKNAPKDNESIRILKDIFKKYNIKAEEGPETKSKGEFGPGVEINFNEFRIFAYKDKNWWKRGDAIGELGGPDSETFYDTGKKHDPEFGKYCHLNCDCGRFIEIGNSVFMQYQKTKSGWKPLKNKNVDFGGGLERLVMLKQGKTNIFETDLYANAIKKIEELSGSTYNDYPKPFEIISDHIKAATFIMGDNKGISPSNVDQGYLVRKLIRRAIRYARQIGITKIGWTHEIAKTIIKDYQDIYSEIKNNQNFIINQLIKEEEKFAKTIKDGLKKAKKIIKQKIPIPQEKFIKIMQTKGKKGIISQILKDIRDNKDTGAYKKFDVQINQDEIKNATITGNEAFNLYQSFGFPRDMMIELAQANNLFVDTIGFKEELEKHQKLSRKGSEQKFKGGLADQSEKTKKLHTAAHLLLQALKEVLGGHIHQRGSNITAERLRFDFSHPEKMTEEQKQKVENLVNEKIKAHLPVTVEEMTVNEAKRKGAEGVFESKYGEKVKVYSIGNFSKEICGGPHVKNTIELDSKKDQPFKIIKEGSSSAGVRRIKAILQ